VVDDVTEFLANLLEILERLRGTSPLG